jgi:site-specific DNA recombinase
MNMIQRAILYIRVSTDEQAEKGYSLKHQEDRLRRYCQFQNIEVVAVFKEDHSAKTFERPEFNKLLAFLKKNKKAADLLLFLKWDRFSRNAGDAYGMINQLNKLETEPQAIEQPLDLDIPENKIMLAFYLAAPEVENDRRSLNTIAGMRRAMKEGRHVTLAPRGYRNARNEMNRPIIEANDDAILVKLAFEEVAKAIYTVMDVWRIVKARGLKVSKNQIWNMLRNKVYCGQIFIPAYKDEPEAIVQATHEPLISIDLFNEVQDALNGRKRKFPSKNTLKEELPLRGFLECRKCGAKLTGSASKGNGGRYFYYHCQKGCNERIKADEANKTFIEEVERASNDPKGIDLFKKELTSHAQKNKKIKFNGLQEIEKEIEKNLQRIENLKDKVADNEMPVDEYLSIKKRCDENINKLKKKLVELKLIDFNLKEYVEVRE